MLDKVSFCPDKDTLWSVGDLIARGQESLQTLNFLYSLGESFQTVLGNHDLHFLAIYCGQKQAKKTDYLEPLLNSDQIDTLVKWLRHKPLALSPRKDVLITHAGLYPTWSFKKALKLSREIEHELSGDNWQALLEHMYGNEPTCWRNELTGVCRQRFIINAFTRMRFVTDDLGLEFATKTSPQFSDVKLKPWFTQSNEKLKKTQRVFFGHWAALMGNTYSEQFVGLDTGYVWGHQMTMFHLEQNSRISVGNLKKK